ncbi:GNAT family N-acetyltransferase [Streptomyces sp. NPDC086787]|uniref:GNAT family N-acetyltransferase n=1 Tax=Streptomyces sp. NPDC086787 TaxID=3365759 RepID=UPI0037F88065
MAADREPLHARRFPEPHGEGLRLRHWDPDSDADVADWLRGRSDPEFLRWNTPLLAVADFESARTAMRDYARKEAEGTCAHFRVGDADSGAALGHIGLNTIDRVIRSGRVGYWVLPEARGRLVATRALALVSRWAFTELDLHRLELGHAVGHAASCRIAQKCGFPAEGTLRGAMFGSGRFDVFRDEHLHARLATDPEPA